MLNVEILLEHTRGSRGEHNSRTMLLPLVQNFTNVVKVSLYHSPSLRGLLKLLLPERFNETVALTHLKVYLTDDTLIMSGYVISPGNTENSVIWSTYKFSVTLLIRSPLGLENLAIYVNGVAIFMGYDQIL